MGTYTKKRVDAGAHHLGFLCLRNTQTIEPTTALTAVFSPSASTRYSFITSVKTFRTYILTRDPYRSTFQSHPPLVFPVSGYKLNLHGSDVIDQRFHDYLAKVRRQLGNVDGRYQRHGTQILINLFSKNQFYFMMRYLNLLNWTVLHAKMCLQI